VTIICKHCVGLEDGKIAFGMNYLECFEVILMSADPVQPTSSYHSVAACTINESSLASWVSRLLSLWNKSNVKHNRFVSRSAQN